MKSSNSSNGSEEVIDLLSHNVIPHNQTDDGNAGYIKAEVTAVLADTTTTPSILATDAAYATATTQDGLLQVANDDPFELPPIARDLTWNDSFYENNDSMNDIIMAFDIDRTKYDTFYLPPLFGILVVTIIISLWYDEYGDLIVMILVLSIAPIVFACILDGYQRRKQFYVKRLHIALTRSGVCIDWTDKPCGQNLMVRNVYMYNQIRTCTVKGKLNCWGDSMDFKVSLHMNGRVRIIDGIVRSQQFVDIVNAMIKHSSDKVKIETTNNVV